MNPSIVLLMKVAIFFAGIAVSYVALMAPLIRRGLIYDENAVPVSPYGTEPDGAAVHKTRRFFLARVAVGWGIVIAAGFAAHALMSDTQWLNYGMPFVVGGGFSMLASPMRLWDRMRPWPN